MEGLNNIISYTLNLKNNNESIIKIGSPIYLRRNGMLLVVESLTAVIRVGYALIKFKK